MPRPLHARIDLAALTHNLGLLRAAAGDSRLLAVVKADAYGHGMSAVACALADAGVDGYGVASLEEALALRAAGITARVLAMEGAFDGEDIAAARDGGIDLVVHDESQIRALVAAAPGPRALDLWLKLDTGMHRLGFPPQSAAALLARLRGLPGVGQLRVMSHLACADDRRSQQTLIQGEAFEQATRALGAERSLANSGGLLGWPQTRLDWVRPGLALYGVSPYAGSTGASLGLRPVMHLETVLISVAWRRRGEAIGYGGSFVCPEDMPVGIAAIGYGDGYPRRLANGGSVRVGGQPARVIGRVSMDMLALDLRGCPAAATGTAVTLWGAGLAVEQVACAADTIPYELLCGLTNRVPRVPVTQGGPG